VQEDAEDLAVVVVEAVEVELPVAAVAVVAVEVSRYFLQR
jgi:hypothetical protein